MSQAIKGCYRDCLRDPGGRLLWQGDWSSNRILHNCNRLLAALLKGEPGMQGLLYWAVGEGNNSWDVLLPNPQPGNTQLTREVARLPLTAGEISYLDHQNHPSASPTSRLEIRLDIAGSTLVSSGFQPLREFGLFGGDATSAPNSGLMVQQAIHPRIDVTPDMTLSRTLHLTFDLCQSPAPNLTGACGGLPVSAIDGVGTEYGAALAAIGVTDVASLAQIDPRRSVGNIPEGKLREFRAKARLALSLPSDLGELSPLGDVSISDFLRTAPASLLAGSAGSGITLEAIGQWQVQLESLQIALDEVQLQQMALGTLVRF